MNIKDTAYSFLRRLFNQSEQNVSIARPLGLPLEQRLVLVVKRIQAEFNKWTNSKGAINGIAPLNSTAVVPDVNLPRYVKRTVQTVGTATFNFANGLIINYDIASTPVNTVPANFTNGIVGDFHVIIVRNSSAASRTMNLPATGLGHKSNTYAIAVGANQRRKLIGIWDGTVWDWTVDAAKTL